MVDLMNLLSDVLIGSFQMLMLNDLGKNMFPYRIKTCWTRILIYGVTALVILGVNHIESTFINIMMVPVSYTIASIVIFQGSVWKKIILTCWDKLIQKEQQATLLLFEQGEDIYADALYKETKILQYLNHSLSKKVLGYLYENANATILEIGAGTGATSDKVLSDIRENKFEEHIVYFYTDISRFFLQRAKERYKECDGKIEMHYQTLDIDEAFSSQLPSNFQADIVIAVGVLNNSVNTDKCIYEINSVMKPGGILLIIETVEDVPDILITQSFMMTEPKDQRKATNTMFLNRKQWLEILEENGFCNSEEFPGYGEYLEVLGQKLFYCTKE